MPIGDWPPPDPNLRRMIDAVYQTIQLRNPDYARISPRNLLSAAPHMLSAGAYPLAPAVGAAQQTGGTGPTITAVPQATSASQAQPTRPAQPAGMPPGATSSGAAQSGSPAATPGPTAMPGPVVSSVPQTIAAAQASNIPTAPVESLLGTMASRGGGSPVLNPQTFNDFWNVMRQYGEGGEKDSPGPEKDFGVGQGPSDRGDYGRPT